MGNQIINQNVLEIILKSIFIIWLVITVIFFVLDSNLLILHIWLIKHG